MILAILACKIREASIILSVYNKFCRALRERERDVCARAEQKLSRQMWRETDVCARAEQKLSRQTGRERDVCARAEHKLSRQRGRERDVCAC